MYSRRRREAIKIAKEPIAAAIFRPRNDNNAAHHQNISPHHFCWRASPPRQSLEGRSQQKVFQCDGRCGTRRSALQSRVRRAKFEPIPSCACRSDTLAVQQWMDYASPNTPLKSAEIICVPADGGLGSRLSAKIWRQPFASCGRNWVHGLGACSLLSPGTGRASDRRPSAAIIQHIELRRWRAVTSSRQKRGVPFVSRLKPTGDPGRSASALQQDISCMIGGKYVPHDRTPLFDPWVLISAIRFPVPSRDYKNASHRDEMVSSPCTDETASRVRYHFADRP